MSYKDVSIIFDLDGTLVDSAPDLLNAVNHVMEQTGRKPISLEVLRSIIGKGGRVMLCKALESNGEELSEEELQPLLQMFLEYYTANIAVDSKPFDGLIQVLDMLQESGAKLGVCTNKREHLAVKVLEELGLKKYFSEIVGPDTLGVSKPHPGHILGTIEKINGNPEKAIMIGDGSPDILAAQAASVPVVAVTFGYTDVPIKELNPDVTIDHFAELPDILKTILQN